MSKTPTDLAAATIARLWRGVWPADAHRMALDLKRAGLLIPETPDVAYGLTVDGGGSRPDGVSCALTKTRAAVVVHDLTDAARVLLTPAECRELAGWLLAAAVHIDTPTKPAWATTLPTPTQGETR